jgi:phosphoglycerate dehydrogenase-like enzyme
MDNVFLTPHVAGRSDRYNEQALEVVSENVGRYPAGARGEMRNLISG